MSKDSQVIDPMGRCVHHRIQRARNGEEGYYTDKWLCFDCKEEFVFVLFPTESMLPGKIEVMPPQSTLRDQFAMAALTGVIAARSSWKVEELPYETAAEMAYLSADAMMEARKK